MAWINTIKTTEGFVYTVGKAVIAEARWTKVHDVWCVALSCRLASVDGATQETVLLPLKEVTAHLHAITTEEQRPL